jgi:hypothetical protein
MQHTFSAEDSYLRLTQLHQRENTACRCTCQIRRMNQAIKRCTRTRARRNGYTSSSISKLNNRVTNVQDTPGQQSKKSTFSTSATSAATCKINGIHFVEDLAANWYKKPFISIETLRFMMRTCNILLHGLLKE